MTKTEAVIRSILGAAGVDILPLAYAVDFAIDLMFFKKIPMDDIHVTKDIYPDVARALKKCPGKASSYPAVSRHIERLANQCWDALVQRGLVEEYLGAPLNDIRAPRDIIFYLAFYSYLDKPFFIVIRQQPALLF